MFCGRFSGLKFERFYDLMAKCYAAEVQTMVEHGRNVRAFSVKKCWCVPFTSCGRSDEMSLRQLEQPQQLGGAQSMNVFGLANPAKDGDISIPPSPCRLYCLKARAMFTLMEMCFG